MDELAERINCDHLGEEHSWQRDQPRPSPAASVCPEYSSNTTEVSVAGGTDKGEGKEGTAGKQLAGQAHWVFPAFVHSLTYNSRKMGVTAGFGRGATSCDVHF